MVTKETFRINGPDTLVDMDAKEIIEFLLGQSRYVLNEYRIIRDFTNVSYSCYVPRGSMDFHIIKSDDRDGYTKGWIKLEFNYTQKNNLTEIVLTANKITKSYIHIEPEHFDKVFKED